MTNRKKKKTVTESVVDKKLPHRTTFQTLNSSPITRKTMSRIEKTIQQN